MVRLYTASLRAAVEAAAAQPRARGRLRWLDFFDALLEATPDGGLKAALHMDGTHMAPTYVADLQRALVCGSLP